MKLKFLGLWCIWILLEQQCKDKIINQVFIEEEHRSGYLQYFGSFLSHFAVITFPRHSFNIGKS